METSNINSTTKIIPEMKSNQINAIFFLYLLLLLETWEITRKSQFHASLLFLFIINF